MKKLTFLFGIVLSVMSLNAQRDSLVVVDQKCYGGNFNEGVYCVKTVNDTLLFIGGTTSSTEGEIYQLYGQSDAFGIFVDSNLNVKKKIVFGAEKTDLIKSILPLSSSLYLILYQSNSTTGEYTVNKGDYDVYYRTYNYDQHWFSSLKQLGGSQKDEAWGIRPKINNLGYLIFGATNSSDGNLSENFGGNDAWIVNLSQSYTLNWSKNYGGSSSDVFIDGFQLSNGDILAFGVTYSNDNQVQGNNGGQDVWLVRVNSLGSILWQKCFGGTGSDILLSVKRLSDDLFMMIGVSNSYNGSFYMLKDQQPQVSSYYGFYYVVNSNGSFVRGIMYSNQNNDVLLTDGVVDGTDVRLYGSMLSKPLFVDFENDCFNTKTFVSISGIVGEIAYCDRIGGVDYYVTLTNSSELPNYSGEADVVVMKVKKQLILGEETLLGIGYGIWPNPVNDFLWFRGNVVGKSFEIVDLSGKVVQDGVLKNSFLNLRDFKPGIYLVRVYGDGFVFVEKFIKK